MTLAIVLTLTIVLTLAIVREYLPAFFRSRKTESHPVQIGSVSMRDVNLEESAKTDVSAAVFLENRGMKPLSEKFAMILNEQDKGRTLEVEAQSLINVRLNENPTTGYRWEIETAGGLEMVGDSFEKTGDAIGAAGVRVFQFRAPGTGSYKLSIKNWRDWEGEGSIIDLFYVTILVK
ncbi:protease inhibitor I42 family protein [Methanosarcina acetivorans]|uniref:Proteinase inhibitor I42 chagasin domain-containing protein n=1 Tax=Methanosarcina acetivorans (strain ATCC 35395 / DSM 2834 / JCM 12185 / C2A) TaxID=188937 RepID=Q8TL24_METAC|nr:protease inhibitor I42 family protein [Methanosarcina acetivorans]AAM06589.1 predicted protein [Methanosarcina acetivorans C2A]